MSDTGLPYEESDLFGVVPIRMHNPMEEAANRYWRASLMWRDKMPTDWCYGDMISELADLRRYRGLAPILAENLLHKVVHSEAEPQEEMTQEIGNQPA